MNNPAEKATLNTATSLLFHIAAGSHTLRRIMGIEVTEGDCLNNRKLRYLPVARFWLVKEHVDSQVLRFDPDQFYKLTRTCSDGEVHMILWLLNVWNSSYAKHKKRTFDLFAALNSLDEENRRCICDWLQRPVWP